MNINLLNIIISLTKFMTTLYIMYILVIYLICRIKKCDVKASTKIFWDYFLSCFNLLPANNSSDMVSYPVYIGIDDTGYPHADIIEDAFDCLAKDFESFYLYNCAQDQNRLFYRFKAELPKKEMSTFDMIQYTQKKCERIVHMFMHRMNPQISHVEFLVATNYIENILTVYIAKNKTGVAENNDLICQLHKQYKEKATITCNIIEERWDDESDDEMGL